MNKKDIKDMDTTAVYSAGLYGVEIKGIEYGLDDYLMLTETDSSGAVKPHKLKIRCNADGLAYVMLGSLKIPLNECVRV